MKSVTEVDVDNKIAELLKLSDNCIFVEYYPHADCLMYKIINVFTSYDEDKLVLCPVTDGISKALDMAIKEIQERKQRFFNL